MRLDLSPSVVHYHLQKLIREGKITRVSRGIYTLNSQNSHQLFLGNCETRICKILRVVVRETLIGNPNITNKLIEEQTGVHKSDVSKLLKELEEMELVERKNMGLFVHNWATPHAIKLFQTSIADPLAGTNYFEKLSNNSEEMKLQFRPHYMRFKTEILKGTPSPEWKEVKIRGQIQKWCYDYECKVQITPSNAIIYVPSFVTDNPYFSFFEAYRKADLIMKCLERDHGYRFGKVEMIAAHNAIINDPLALISEFDGVIDDPEKRLRLDKSQGFPELEAIDYRFCEEDIIKILDRIYLPVIKDEYNPWKIIKKIQKIEINLAENINKHLEVMEIIREEGKALIAVTEKLVEVGETLKAAVEDLKKQR